MKKKTKLFKHFITILHCCALAIPLFTLIGVFIFNYVSPIAYFASHKTGNQSTYQVQYKYQSNEVNTSADLIVGNIYEFVNTIDSSYFNNNINCSFVIINGAVNFDNLLITDNTTDTPTFYEGYSSFEITGINNNLLSILIYFGDIYQIEFYCTSISIGDENTIFNLSWINNIQNILNYDFLSYTDYNEIESVEIVNHNDFEDMQSYVPKTFDDACFTALKSLGALDSNYEDMQSAFGDYSFINSYYLDGNLLNEITTNTGIINYDWLKMFRIDGHLYNNESSWIVFLNYYINYVVNISLILFMPSVIICFFRMCTNLIYKFADKGDE